MKKRLAFLASTFLILGLTLGMSYLSRASATTVLGTNELVSYNSSNTGPSSGASWIATAAISDDSNTAVWYSNASDVVSGVTGGSCNNLYMRNLTTSTNSLVNVEVGGSPACVQTSGSNVGDFAVSSTGRFVAYNTDDVHVVSSPTVPYDSSGHIYLRDTLLNTSALVDISSSGAIGNIGGSVNAPPVVTGVSDDGRFVAFTSVATNLLSSNNPVSTNSTMYPYIKDMLTGQVINPMSPNGTTRVNAITNPEVQMSCDGSEVMYTSTATNLTPQDNGNSNVYLLDLRNGYHLSNLTYAGNGNSYGASISCNGRYIAMTSRATNLTSDTVSGTLSYAFRYDRFTNAYSLLAKSTSGYMSTTSGGTLAPNTATIYNINRQVSDNGLVVFKDSDTNLVSPAAAQNDLYIRDPDAGTTALVPVSSSGIEQNTALVQGVLAISADGKSVLYNSSATNLIPGVTTSGSHGNVVLSEIQ